QRGGTLYEFQVGRLTTSFHGTNVFPSYLDTYGKKPFIYLSSYNTANGYNRYGSAASGDAQLGGPSVTSPYLQATPATFWKPNSCQIISAGRNGTFSAGGVVYTPGNRTANAAITEPGGLPTDDQANFAAGLISSGQ